MSIVINSNPGNYYSAHGDLIFVVYEAVKANDPITYPDYKYVADIYIDGTLITRIKKVPQPDNKRGVFNIGDVIRSYIGATFNPAPSVLVAQELALTDFFAKATVKFGEEYDFVLYTNLVIDSERTYYNHYNGRLIGQNTNLTPFLDRVASIRPYQTAVNIGDTFTLLPYFASSTSPVTVTITKYGPATPGSPVLIEWGYFTTDPYATVDTKTMQFGNYFASGSNSFTLNYTSPATSNYLVLKEPIAEPVKTTWFNTILNNGTMPDSVFRAPVVIGSYRYYVSRIPVVLDSTNFSILFGNASPGPASPLLGTSFSVNITPSDANSLQVLNVSPGEVNVLTPGFIDSSVLYYTVAIGATAIYRFDLVCEARFEVYRVHFLNKLGGFETRNFTKVSRPSIKITKTDYGKLTYTIDSSGNVVYYNGNGVYNETKSVFASQFTEALSLNTDILTDDEYTWLGELMLSPLVYLERTGYFLPIAITANNYEFRKQVNDKLTNLTIDIMFGDQFNAQYR